MAWTVTIETVDCDAMSTLITGASVRSGTVFLGNTDMNGQIIIIADDFWEQVILSIGKGSTGGSPGDPGYHPGYIEKNVVIHQDDDGDLKTVCLNEAPIPEPGEPIECFVMTATTGSTASVEVQRLRELRDRVSARSRLSAELIEVVYGEYYEFSPGIAAELRANPLAREAVLATVVRPLLAWYGLAGALALEREDEAAVSGAVAEMAAARGGLDGGMIGGLLERIRAGEALPASAPGFLVELAPRVAAAAGHRNAAWAILDPLIRAWRMEVANREAVVDEVGEWLATAPLEYLAPGPDPELLDEELRVLAGFLAFRPLARAELGARLRTAWPGAADALRRAGMLSSPETGPDSETGPESQRHLSESGL
jgi:hypothetical protein